MNYLRTAILLAGLTGLFMAVGYLIGGASGATVALVVAAATNLFAYWNSDRVVLSMYGAHEVDQHTAPELVSLVAALAARAGLPMPRVFLMDNPQPNAFATGRNPQNAAVAVTRTIPHNSHDPLDSVILMDCSSKSICNLDSFGCRYHSAAVAMFGSRVRLTARGRRFARDVRAFALCSPYVESPAS